ncbi:MAG: carboxypeptidase-like regulatory domain-containing protein, partial [Candidatus Methylomirabilis sp.]|nr:carboxypeptidase-like regulatory domain-containing protein [Deltaproteobacteria bacterium]
MSGMTLRGKFGFIVLATVIGGCSSVEGTVVDVLTGDSVEGATVTVGSAEGRSNASGAFQVGGLGKGYYNLTVSKPGYESAGRGVLVGDGTSDAGAFYLVPDAVPTVEYSEYHDNAGLVYAQLVSAANAYVALAELDGAPPSAAASLELTERLDEFGQRLKAAGVVLEGLDAFDDQFVSGGGQTIAKGLGSDLVSMFLRLFQIGDTARDLQEEKERAMRCEAIPPDLEAWAQNQGGCQDGDLPSEICSGSDPFYDEPTTAYVIGDCWRRWQFAESN